MLGRIALFILLYLIITETAFSAEAKKIVWPWEGIKLSQKELTIPLGEERSIAIAGRIKGALCLNDYNQAVVSVRYDDKTKTIWIKGLERGATSLTVLSGKEKKTVALVVKKYAGRLPGSLSVSITGTEMRPELVTQAIEASLVQKASIEPGATLSTEVKSLPSPVAEGDVKITVTISGKDLIAMTRELDVHILHRSIEVTRPDCLVISNNPEKITSEGVLLDERLLEKKSARFLFHHSNSPGSSTRRLVAKLINPGDSACELHIIHTLVGPSNDEIYAGHMAASLFWNRWQRIEGYIATIPPGGTFVLDDIPIKPGYLVSGLSHFTHLDGPAPRLVMEALGGEHDLSAPSPAAATSRGIFLNPGIEIEKTHTVGKGYTFINLGGKPYVKEKTTGQENLGNYGVIYTIDIAMENPLDEENDVSICFTPGGGPARGIFLIGTSLLETSMAGHLQEIVLHRTTLAPGELQKVRLITFPQSGSNYPVRIVVKSKLL
jgi:hypothetical protein